MQRNKAGCAKPQSYGLARCRRKTINVLCLPVRKMELESGFEGSSWKQRSWPEGYITAPTKDEGRLDYAGLRDNVKRVQQINWRDS